jgi:hypothetical protein
LSVARRSCSPQLRASRWVLFFSFLVCLFLDSLWPPKQRMQIGLRCPWLPTPTPERRVPRCFVGACHWLLETFGSVSSPDALYSRTHARPLVIFRDQCGLHLLNSCCVQTNNIETYFPPPPPTTSCSPDCPFLSLSLRLTCEDTSHVHFRVHTHVCDVAKIGRVGLRCLCRVLCCGCTTTLSLRNCHS